MILSFLIVSAEINVSLQWKPRNTPKIATETEFKINNFVPQFVKNILQICLIDLICQGQPFKYERSPVTCSVLYNTFVFIRFHNFVTLNVVNLCFFFFRLNKPLQIIIMLIELYKLTTFRKKTNLFEKQQITKSVPIFSLVLEQGIIQI